MWPNRGSGAAPLTRVVLFVLTFAPGVCAASEALFDLSAPERGPFPSDVFTVPEPANRSGIRVDLPLPNCSLEPSRCEDVTLLNALDGFNLQPRLQLPFTEAVDLDSVDSSRIFLVELGPAASGVAPRAAGAITGIRQVVFDPETQTLFAESETLLQQSTRYALIATRGLRSARGAPVRGSQFARFLEKGSPDAPEGYRSALRAAIGQAGLHPAEVVTASVFTTLSATAELEQMRARLRAVPAERADFELSSDGARTVFPLASVERLTLERQVATSAPQFSDQLVSLDALGTSGVVGALAFGRYASPQFRTAAGVIPQGPTGSDGPPLQSLEDVFFNLWLPAGPRPVRGWPVALFGHGLAGDKNSGSVVAEALAARGIATLAINAVGHGGGPEGTLVVSLSGGRSVRLPGGGRSGDLNGDGAISPTEGAFAPSALISTRDSLRQSAVDHMQLVHLIRSSAVDVDGDGESDLDPERIYYTGISLGGILGTILLGVEGDLSAGVPNVAGGPMVEIVRLSPDLRPLLLTPVLAGRTPPLLNAPMEAPQFGFEENLPLREEPAVTNTVPGARDIQELIERMEWLQQSGSPVAYARHIRAQPLGDNSPGRVLFQFARGDTTVPNPTTAAILRAGELEEHATLLRVGPLLDALVAQGAPSAQIDLLANPHGYLFLAPVGGGIEDAARGLQQQIAEFFASDGTSVIDPDGEGSVFETPVALPLPEDLGFIRPR